MKWFALLSVFLFLYFSSCEKSPACNLPPDVLQEIKHHQKFVDEVIKAVIDGEYSGRVYEDLTNFVDKFGNRLAGSDALENAINYLGDRMEKELNGIGKVTYDPVEVPVWERGVEEGEVIGLDRPRKLRILGLGYSTRGDLTAPLIVVNDFEELEAKASEVEGKIVLFNGNFTTYEDSVKYRGEGPAKASKLGAVAALVRSITPFSIGSIHTGSTDFGPDDTPIPAAAVSLEDADFLNRIYREGIDFKVKLLITSEMKGKGNSSNLLLDFTGSMEPQSYAVLSGHIDSWDVGQGALDDGGGAFVTLHSLLLLKHLNVSPPRRTFRSILWTSEELGLIGAKTYLKAHRDELKNWIVAYESDNGVLPLLGLNLASTGNSACILEAVLSLFKDIDTTTLHKVVSAGSDITEFQSLGIPLIEPYLVPNDYFWFHHTEGDSMRTLNSTVMDKHLVLATATTYILANISMPLRDIQNNEN